MYGTTVKMSFINPIRLAGGKRCDQKTAFIWERKKPRRE
jgi:hypothetical protein